MRLSWIRVAALLIAAIVVHDAWMATAGHGALASMAATSAATDHEGGHHRHHDAATPDDSRPDTGDMLEHCGRLSVAAPLNRDMTPSLDTAPVGVMPLSTCLARFGSTSRGIVETPPLHPPDLDRAFFQVYRI